MMGDLYRLGSNGTPLPEPDTLTWARAMEGDRRVAETIVDGYRVSTVFLGIDHNFGRGKLPVLWETMVFPEDSYHDLYYERYTSVDDALEGHQRVVATLPQLISSDTDDSPMEGGGGQ